MPTSVCAQSFHVCGFGLVWPIESAANRNRNASVLRLPSLSPASFCLFLLFLCQHFLLYLFPFLFVSFLFVSFFTCFLLSSSADTHTPALAGPSTRVLLPCVCCVSPCSILCYLLIVSSTSFQDSKPSVNMSDFLRPQQLVIRLYILRCSKLCPKDTGE